MNIQISDGRMSTEDVKAVIQRERDRARNEGAEVRGITLLLDDGSSEDILYDGDVDFYAGKFVIVKNDEAWTYVHVSRVRAIRFYYQDKR